MEVIIKFNIQHFSSVQGPGTGFLGFPLGSISSHCTETKRGRRSADRLEREVEIEPINPLAKSQISRLYMKMQLSSKFDVYPSGKILLIGVVVENSKFDCLGILPQEIRNITIIIVFTVLPWILKSY